MSYLSAWRRLLANTDRVNDLAVTVDQRLDGIQQGIDNQSTSVNERLDSLQQGIDHLAGDLNSRLDRLQQGIDNLAGDLNGRLDRLIETATNQSTDANLRPDRIIDALGGEGVNGPLQGDEEAVADQFDIAADTSLIERFSSHWDANSRSYKQSLCDLRDAARRLLPLLQTSGAKGRAVNDEEMKRLVAVEKQVTCLARQPLFFSDMFHGVTLQPDGSFKALKGLDEIYLRANGLLGIEDRVAVRQVYERLRDNSDRPLRVVEIGSAAGRGSTQIGGEIVKATGGILYCIDPWKGPLYFAFLANIQIFGLEPTVVPVRSPSVEAAVLFEDGSLDAVFVDGSHLYPDVLADIDAYLPKIQKNGIIFGHDLYDLPSRFDRNELLGFANVHNAMARYTNPNGLIERVDVHAGVVLAVQDRFGDDVEHFTGSVVWAKKV